MPGYAPEAKTRAYGKVFDAGDLNAGAVAFASPVDVRGWHSGCIDFEFDNSGGMTAVVITYKGKRARGATKYIVPEIIAGGTAGPLSITWTIANGTEVSLPINISDYDELEVTVTATGARAGDLVTGYLHLTND